MKDNKLIAEFMGLKDGSKYFCPPLEEPESNPQITSVIPVRFSPNRQEKYIIVDDMRYHRSWNWLMPVIKTIRDHVNVDMGFEEYDNWRENFKQIDPYNYNLSECYKAVVEFIKQYNNDTI